MGSVKNQHFRWQLAIVFLLAAVLLGFVAFALRNWQRTRLALDAKQTGLVMFENRNWEKAASCLGRYLVIDPRNVDILDKYASAQLNIRPLKFGNIQQAVSAYRNILRIEKNNFKAVEKLVSLYIELDLPSESQLIAKRFLQTNDDPQIRTLYAIALAKQRQYASAFTELQSVIDDHPDQILAYEALAQLSQSSPQDAPVNPETILNKMVEINPLSAHALIARAAFYLRLPDRQKAIQDLMSAEKLDLSDVNVRIRLAGELSKCCLFEKARGHFKDIMSKYPDNQDLWRTWATLEFLTQSKQDMAFVASEGLNRLSYQPWDFMPLAVELFIYADRLDDADKYLGQLKQKDISPPAAAFLQGLVAQKRNQDWLAVASWRQAQQLGFDIERTSLAMADAFSRMDDNQSAVIILRKLLALQPDSFIARSALAARLLTLANYNQSVEQARLAIELEPNNINSAKIYFNALMQSALNSRDFDKQIKFKLIENYLVSLQNRVGTSNDLMLMQFNLALEQKNFPVAEKLLSEIKSVPSSPSLETEMAETDLLIAKGQIDKAVSNLYVLINKFPDSFLPPQYLASLLAQQGKNADCLKMLENTMRACREPFSKRRLALLLADYYKLNSQNDDRLRFLNDVSLQMPFDIPIKRELLRCPQIISNNSLAQSIVDSIRNIEGQQGWQWKCEQASLWFNSENFRDCYPQIVALLKEVLLTVPDEFRSTMQLADTYKKAGQIKLAVEIYRQALNISPSNLQAAVSLAMLLQFDRRYDDSALLYDKILSVDPNNIVVLNNLAWILCEEQHDYDRALQVVRHAMKLSSKYPDLIDTCGVVHFRLGSFDVAQNYFTQALDMCDGNSPAKLIVNIHLAKALAASGKNTLAVDYLNKAINLNTELRTLPPDDLEQAKQLLAQLLENKNYDPDTDKF